MEVDSRAFHLFITDANGVYEDGKVASKKRVLVLSHFLKGEAHEFYIRDSDFQATLIVGGCGNSSLRYLTIASLSISARSNARDGSSRITNLSATTL